MQKEIELEGSPAEATWAMITVIVVIIVVVIFCCFVPFWRALKKRDHHWEDPENDPRWDLDNFQFSTTSPRPERKLGDDNGDYNRLSVVSNNNSSTHTSNSAVNNNFRNNYLLPRFSDQVEFKFPTKYDDGFTRGEVDDGSEDTDDNKSTITTSVPPSLTSQGKTNRSSPVKKLHKMYRKQLENSPTNETPEENILSEHSGEPRLKVATQANQSQSNRTKTVFSSGPQKGPARTQTEPSGPRKVPVRPQGESIEPKKVPVRTQKGPVRPQTELIGPNKGSARTQIETVGAQKGPVAPPKRNSKLLSANGPTGQSSGVNQEKINGDSSSISPPTRKTFKKIKKPLPSASGDGKVISST